MQATIEKVFTKPREWNGQYGPGAAVKVLFSDESEGEYLTKPDKAQEHIERLQALVGKPSDFDLEAKPDFNGMKQYKIKDYPGRPSAQGGFGGGGGGGRQFIPAYHQTKEGHDAEQERMDRRTALMQAVALCQKDLADSKGPLPTVEHIADQFYAWLRKTAGSTTANPNPAPAASSAPAQATKTVNTVQTQPTQKSFDDDPEGDPASGHVPSRPQGSTADSVEIMELRKGMAWLKGWMKHNEMDPNDVEMRRYFVGVALGEDIESCKDLNSGQWAEVKSVLGKMDDEEILGVQAAFRTAQEIHQYAPAEG